MESTVAVTTILEGELILELLDQSIEEPPPVSRAERAAHIFHEACLIALNGLQVTAKQFVLTTGFRDARGSLIRSVGSSVANNVMTNWFYDNRTLFVNPRNVT